MIRPMPNGALTPVSSGTHRPSSLLTGSVIHTGHEDTSAASTTSERRPSAILTARLRNDSARPAIPPDEPCTPAQNAQFWLMFGAAYLIWQVSSLAVSQDLVNCGLG